MTIATKRMIKLTLWLLLIALNIVGFMAVSNVSKNGAYTVDTQEFTSVVEWGEDVSIGDIKIIDNRIFGLSKTTLTEDMIVSIEDTDTAGKKKIVFEHNNKQFTVVFDVKYKIELVADGKVIDTQMVVTPDELNLPTPQARTGYEFSHWDYDFSQGFTQSVKINAVFRETQYPTLNMITATYGDTLADLELPSDERGHWEFIESLDTPVGNVGKNFHNVRFVFNGDDSYCKYSEIEVKVNKKELQFTVDDSKNVFTYDGLVHTPAYSLDTEVDSVVIHGGDKTDAGTHEYRLEIVDERYSGTYYGKFEITKPTVTVNISSYGVEYEPNLVLPKFRYDVEGFENVDILNIEIIISEQVTEAKEYELVVDMEKANPNVIFIVNKGSLIIYKADYNPEDVPQFKYDKPTYGDKLADLSFTNPPNGVWKLETKDENGNDIIIDNMSGISFYAYYIPRDTNYNSIRVPLEITEVNKKELTIEVVQYEFTYEEGVPRQIIYRIVDKNGNEYDLTVNGNAAEIRAGDYEINLVIDDECYCGELTTTLVIHKGTPVTDFDQLQTITWKEGLKLSDVILPTGYTWKLTPSISGVGEYEFEAIYTPEDTDNYVSEVTGKFKVKVLTAEPTFANIEESYDKVYDALRFDIKNSGISAYYMTVKPVIKYYKGIVELDEIDSSEEIDEIINTGVYTVVISISAEGNYHAASVRRIVTVTAAENEQTVDTEQTAKYLDTTADKLTLPENIEGTWSWSISVLDQVGEMTLTAIYTPDSNGNYEPRTETVTVTVGKKPVSVPDVKNKQYTGQPISIEFSDNDLYDVSGDESATDYGTYTVNFTLKSPGKYEWEGQENDVTVSDTYKITEAPNDWVNKPQDVTAVYDPNGNYIVASAEHGTPTYVYKTLDGTVVEGPLSVGEYYVTVIVAPLNYEHLELTVKLVITQATVPAPNGNALTYNGAAQAVTITDENLGELYDIVAGSYVNATNAGNASTVVVRLTDSVNYKWDKAAGADYTVSVTIAKATLSFAEGSKTTITGNSTWTYTEDECVVNKAELDTASVALGAQTVLMYSTNNLDFCTLEEFSENNKKNGLFNAGTYYVKTVVVENSNWSVIESNTVSFTVNKATPTEIKAGSSRPYSGESDAGLYYENSLVFSASDFKVYFGSTLVDATVDTDNYTLSGGFNGANTKFAFKVTPTDSKNFESAVLEYGEVVPLKTVATIYRSGSEFAKYGTIENALENAQSGDTVWVNMDATGKVYIKENATVPGGVTLVLPFGNFTDSDSGKNTGDAATKQQIPDDQSTPDVNEKEYYVFANTLSEKYMKTWVKIAPNVTLTVTGTLDIAGEMVAGSGGNMSGYTGGRYATLELEDGAKIEATGTIKCYGFIENAEGNENGQLRLKNGANIYIPFVLYDFKGGTIMSAIYDDLSSHHCAPFHQFGFSNVSVSFRIDYGATMTTMCNLYSNNQVNHTNGDFIGITSKHFLQLTDSQYSYLEAKYDPDTKITAINIYGGAKLNDLSLTVKTILGNVTVKSSDFVFALSWLFDITLDNANGQGKATFTMPYSYKILPGSKLTVEDGAILNVGSITVYDDTFKDTLSGTYPGTGVYPTVYPDISSNKGEKLAGGLLIVRGIVNATNLAGDVYTDSNGAIVKVTGGTTITTYEPTVITKGTIKGKVDDHQTIVKTLKLIYGNELTDIELNIAYISVSGEWVPGIDYVTIQIPNGMAYSIEQTVIVNADGSTSYGGAVSGVGGENTFITVERGALVTVTLGAGQIITKETELKLSSVDELNQINGTRSVAWYPEDDGLPKIITVPIVQISGISVLSKYTITYKDLGTANPYVEIVMKKSKTGWKPSVSFTVTATKSTTTGTGTMSNSGTFTAEASTTVKVYENDTLTVS